MSARLQAGARPGTDASERACTGCGQPLSRHESAPMPAIYEKTVTAVFGRAIRNAQRLRHLCDTECATSCPLPANRSNSSRVFPCTAEHVSAVRAFTRTRLAGHPARDDAVLVISELAANAAAYSVGRWLLVHVTDVSATHAAVLITEWRGPGTPQVTDASPDAESGRGLAIVRMLSCLLHVCEADDVRNILAVVPADPPGSDMSERDARPARRPARRTARSKRTRRGPG